MLGEDPSPGGDAPEDTHVPQPLLERLAGRVGDGRRKVVAAFAAAMLRRVPPGDLEGTDPDALAEVVAGAFTFVDSRTVGEVAIRTLNPDVSVGGWSHPGTVVQVSTEDRPFLLSTIREELRHRGHDIVRVLHPVIGVERGADGRITGILPARAADRRESLLHIELDVRLPPDEHPALEKGLRDVLRDVADATRDFPAMRARVERLAALLHERPPPAVPAAEAEEVAALVRWLLDGNFLLLGCREYRLVDVEGERGFVVVPGSGLGILADTSASRYTRPVPIDEADAGVRRRHGSRRLLHVAASRRVSTVHQRQRLVNVWVKDPAEEGGGGGEVRLLGLFTRRAGAAPSSTVPVLRTKLDTVLEREDIVEDSHDERRLVALFEAVPKDELFASSTEDVHATLVALLAAEENQDVAVIPRVDEVTRTVSTLVAVPRDSYDAALRNALEDLFGRRFAATWVDVDLSLRERPQALLRLTAHIPDAPLPSADALADLEADVRRLCRSWSDELADLLDAKVGSVERHRLVREVAGRLPPAYRNHTTPRDAAEDVVALDALARGGAELAVFLRDDGGPLARVRILKRGAGIELSAVLPILESLGMTVSEELPFRLSGAGPEMHAHDYGVHDAGGAIDVAAHGERLADAILAAWRGACEVDSLNRLVLRAGLGWEWVALLRAYRRYARQIGTVYTAEYVNDALAHNPQVAADLVALFQARFDPRRSDSDDDLDTARARVVEGCEAVGRLDDDRILRTFLALVDATVRTNAYHRDEEGCLALKLASEDVPRIPKPKPFREIFVYSPEVEGVHLRGGPIARGGIRWSERRDDVRAEVLELMQAQMLKNALIVPTGAKGGFVLKRPPADRDGLLAAVRRHYADFIRALLEVTDNVVGGEVRPPDGVRRHDGDDPYLVVAADRGTAGFSDLANAIAEEHGFWLGDAFASGGSRGYDHKALAITARGAWVAARRHFRELGMDVDTDGVSAVGIGDMSGDVFGNGMLQTDTLRLVAAFDHRDIFLDPDPDPRRAFDERYRLAALGQSSWQDYDPAAISAGGGVWSRTVKSVPLSDAVREVLRVDSDRLSPPELIRAILSAPVDLLFAGGIGTFVKASTESHADIGDRSNDEVRVDATQVRARVVVEGANLALTQRARVQYARRGGRVNADFIDNAAGVDISDREVNLKILLGLAVDAGALAGGERDGVLAEVTDDVVAACLDDVDRQTWALLREAGDSPQRMEAYHHLMDHLQARGVLDRDVEALPGGDEMEARREAGAGLTRPELAVLLAAAKRDLHQDLAASELVDRPSLRPALPRYFPSRLLTRFGDLVSRHRLRRDLVATYLANDVVDRLGVTFVHRLARELGTERWTVVAGYWVAREVVRVDRYRSVVARLERAGAAALAAAVDADVAALLEALARTYVRSGQATDVDGSIAVERDAFDVLEAAVVASWRGKATAAAEERAGELVDAGVEPDVAVRVANILELTLAPDVAAVARRTGNPPAAVAEVFLVLSDALGLRLLRRLLDGAVTDDRWARWEHRGLIDDLRALHRAAAEAALAAEPGRPEREAALRFVAGRQEAVGHAAQLLRQIEEEMPLPRLDALGVVVRTLRDAVGA